MARSLVEAKQSTEAGTLLKEMGSGFDSSDGRRTVQNGVKELLRGKTPADAAKVAVSRVGEIAALVAAKVPAEATIFNVYLRTTAHRVADAAKKGDFSVSAESRYRCRENNFS